MYKYINQIISYFTTKSTQPIININKDIAYINMFIDTKTEEVGLYIDVHPYDIIDDQDKMIQQAEKFAYGLYLMCENKSYISKLILENMNNFKKKSSDNSVFVDNVLFFWNHYINNLKPIDQDQDPLIRPSRVFKQN